MKLRYLFEFYATIFIPLLYFFVLLLASRGGTIWTPISFQFFGLILVVIGLSFWILSYLQLGKSFGVLPRKQKRVNTGLYRRYRHPMYIGIGLTFFGLSLANQSQEGLLGTILVLLPVLFVRAKLEERSLLN